MDSALIPDGVKRCPMPVFLAGLAAGAALLLWGLYAAVIIFKNGLNVTGMNDNYGFALWIWADLGIIALGGGAFFTGFLKYIIGKDELKNIVNFAVTLGVICYVSAFLILGIDVGQPIRAWHLYWHPNVHSMLAEVAFCLACYLIVLIIEFIPLVLENRKLSEKSFLHRLSHIMHENMAIFAAVGVFLSCFHQGSLGGLTGVMFGRPFAFREHIAWLPYTFFLFTWSAAAYGPCFTLAMTKLVEKISGKKLVKDNVIHLLAKISGWMIFSYIVAKIIDTAYWAFETAPSMGFTVMEFYSNNPLYRPWILIVEIGLCGIVPALILITNKGRSNPTLLVTAVILGCIGVSLNRWVLVLQTMAIPVMPFDKWSFYMPTWPEIATTLMPLALGIIVVMLAYRYLPIFPQERELNRG